MIRLRSKSFHLKCETFQNHFEKKVKNIRDVEKSHKQNIFIYLWIIQSLILLMSIHCKSEKKDRFGNQVRERKSASIMDLYATQWLNAVFNSYGRKSQKIPWVSNENNNKMKSGRAPHHTLKHTHIHRKVNLKSFLKVNWIHLNGQH